MANATSNGLGKWKEFVNRGSYKITNGETIPVNRLVGMTGDGEIQNAGAGTTPVGLGIAPYDGIYEHLTGSATYDYKASIRGTVVEENIAVTGVSSRADVRKAVYASDNQTFSLTPTDATEIPAGYVHAYRSAGYADVAWYSLDDQVKLANPRRTRLDLTTLGSNALGGTGAVTLHSRTVYDHFKVLSVSMECQAYDTGIVAGDQDINLANGAVDLTGGVINYTAADCSAAADQGTVVDGTAITAGNEFHPGDTLNVKMAAGGTGFTADKTGQVGVFAIIEILPGY